MQAIEFIAELKKDVVRIPKEYIGNLGNTVRVIILVEEKKVIPNKAKVTKSKKPKKKFSAFKVDTKGLKVNREEANVRSNLL